MYPVIGITIATVHVHGEHNCKTKFHILISCIILLLTFLCVCFL